MIASTALYHIFLFFYIADGSLSVNAIKLISKVYEKVSKLMLRGFCVDLSIKLSNHIHRGFMAVEAYLHVGEEQ